MASRYKVPEGLEVRGLVCRIYPTATDVEKLLEIEDELRYCWNWMVRQQQDVIDARQAYAGRYGLVGPRPERPDYSQYPDTADGHKASHAAKEAYIREMREWHEQVHKATEKVECCAWRPKIKDVAAEYGLKYDYQLLARVTRWRETEPVACAHVYQALVKNFLAKVPGARRKKFRRRDESMPLQTRSEVCFEMGSFGKRGKNEHFYNCQIKFNGLKIKGRLPGRAPWGRVLEGVSISRRPDGWYASIKQEVPPRVLPEPVPGSVIGIDAGLDLVAAMSDGHTVANPRGVEYAERIAGRQAAGKDIGRLQQKVARHLRNLLYTRVLKYVETYETIAIEKLQKRIGQMGGSRKVSVMRKMAEMLKERYGSRVREVDPAYTSQTCSQCGEISKESWSYDNGPTGQCPKCGHRENRDVNAARNIAAMAA